MILKRFLVGELSTNCYIFGDADTGEVAVIDPGAESKKLINEIESNNYKVKYILLTHGHFDHILGIKPVLDKYKPQVAIHKDDAMNLYDEKSNFTVLDNIDFNKIKPDILLKDGDVLTLGKHKLEIIHTPGHTNGGISILSGDIIFTGDTLFNQSVGRTDFKYGDFSKLEKSILKLYTLSDETKVFPGHGLSTTIGREKNSNPYVRLI